MNLTLNETFLAVFCSLAILSAIATGAGQWATRQTLDASRLARLGLVNSRLRASWSVLAVFTVAFGLGPAALLLEVDPVGLVRGRKGPPGEGFALDQYVSDRPYAASSFLSVAIAQVFGSAMAGRSRARPRGRSATA